MHIATIYWDPDSVAFTIPFFHWPVAWYSILIAFGFVVGYFLIVRIFQRHLTLRTQNTPIVLHWGQFLKSLQKGLSTKDQAIETFCSGLQKKAYTRLLQNRDSNALRHALSEQLEQSDMKVLGPSLEGVVETHQGLAHYLADRLTWHLVLGTIIGARLGEVFFYDFQRYWNNPIEIFMTWHGGLASHGGVIGVVTALWIFFLRTKPLFPKPSFVWLLDCVAIPSAFVSMCIRIGNFFNQEILGYASDLPWAVLFGHPMDGGAVVPRHPVQLYEALVYGMTFIFLFSLWSRMGEKLKAGIVSGLLFILIFGSRILIEFLKVPQVAHASPDTMFKMGQLLSVPLVLFGFWLLRSSRSRSETLI